MSDNKKAERAKQAVKKAGRALFRALPILLGTMLIISLALLIPKSFYVTIFRGNLLVDSIVGTVIGSISAGNPITSYIIGGELLKQGISLLAVTAFLVAWVTVGMVQLPAEIMMLGKKFAILRNILSFVFAIIVAIITVLLFGLF